MDRSEKIDVRTAAAALSARSKEGLQKLLRPIAHVGARLATPAVPVDGPPLRAELFTAEQMAQHGRALAALHKRRDSPGPDRLLARLADNDAILAKTCGLLMATVKADQRLTPAAEWLLDNFYLIQEQIRTARRDLPKGYSEKLPQLSTGPSAGLPRVYDIALETVSHGDGRVDSASLRGFIAAYQTVAPLMLGELWAVPIMLRLALIENLRRAGTRLFAGRTDRSLANAWAERMIEVAAEDPKSVILEIADMARTRPPQSSAFVAEFARRLQGQGAALALPLTWLEQLLSESGQTIENLAQEENRQQAADQVSISNSIGSLRFLAATDWPEFVETMSLVEQTLRRDPARVYANMDFTTRDRCRHAVERIALRSPRSELEVARLAVELAEASLRRQSADERYGHVGFYLIDRGVPALESAAGMRVRYLHALRRGNFPSSLPIYLDGIMLITAVFTAALVVNASAEGVRGWMLAATALLSLLCASQLGVAVANWVATLLCPPRALPRMDYSEGVPTEARTLVVVPSMLASAVHVDELLQALEVRFLANRSANVHFGLLTDFVDAAAESVPHDDMVLQLVQRGIETLNEKYPQSAAEGDAFYLFHRPRRWNGQEKLWMGHERKRGKLADLNALLRGRGEGRFLRIVGAIAALRDVRYVITLDTDTLLPKDAVRELAAAMAHPLNRPRYDERRQCIVEGYGILQPRIAPSLIGSNRSRYARLWGSEPGVDPYTRAISDVYQDLFGEGSFIGKGIYDVDAFEATLKDRFPENRILSHDLLEGCYARSGLVSDVQLYEEYPPRYLVDVSRRLRWIRGDWQIAGWLLPRVPVPADQRARNVLSALSRWKIFDNLRRSLVPVGLVALLIFGWMILASSALWTVAVLGIILIPPLLVSILEMLRKRDDVLLSQHLFASLRSMAQHFAQVAFSLSCLPYEAFISLNAIVRAGWRMLVSHRRLLEWTPSAQANNGASDLWTSIRAMWIAPFVGLATIAYLFAFNREALDVALPILCLWLAAPGLAWWTSLPYLDRPAQLSFEQVRLLRKLARKNWHYFETFVGPDDNWLPPDNYQEQPVAIVAHRTSPTNIGLALLANLAAYDLGYLTMGEMIERTSATFSTMADMARHNGHFFNWYDTQARQRLSGYVSTVDSGNLIAHLLTLRAGLLTLADEAILSLRWFDGLRDTYRLLVDVVGNNAVVGLADFERCLGAARAASPASLDSTWWHLNVLSTSARAVAAAIDSSPAAPDEAKRWSKALVRQCKAGVDELALLAPWVASGDGQAPEAAPRVVAVSALPTLRELALRGSDPSTSGEPAVAARERIVAIDALIAQATEFSTVDYEFLFDRGRRLLSIGYDVVEQRRDASFYDLLASEARVCSFVGIAQGKLPQENWFALGRMLTRAGGTPTLLSWSGSMFEYLMPSLIMPSFANTLLDQTYKAAVQRQIEYGRRRGVAWGISECAYNTVDVALNYQYRAFGVPGLGLKSGLAEDLVIAPYASALALTVKPVEACANIERMIGAGFAGRFGLYDAIDYTPSRVPRGQPYAIVQAFMAHHQGMTLLALLHVLEDGAMQRRFESDPLFQSAMLLLQERVPRATGFYARAAELADLRPSTPIAGVALRTIGNPETRSPELQLLSNGRLHVMVTAAGGGYSRWGNFQITRWREDPTRDSWGAFCYIRDVSSGAFWSAAHQPTGKRADHYEAIFSESRAEFRRRDGEFETHTEIAVSPEDDIELRRIRISNRARSSRTIDVTSYAEVVLAPPAADAQAPAFGNLFVQTEILPQKNAILCTRRPRSASEAVPWMFHLMKVHGDDGGAVSYETDRGRFIGRCNTTAAPAAMLQSVPLSGSAGSVLDPVAAIRRGGQVKAGASLTIDIVTGISETREGCLALIDKYQDPSLAERVFDLAWTHSSVTLRQLNASEAEAQLYNRLAAAVLYANPALRADPSVIKKNRRGQSGLWGYAISGDLPIVLLQIEDAANIDLVRQMIRAHAYWRQKGLAVDLVIWNEDHSGYRQALHDQISGLIAAGVEAHLLDRPGGIFVRRGEQIADEDRLLFQTVARAVIVDRLGTLAEQVGRRLPLDAAIARPAPPAARRREAAPIEERPRRALAFDNGLGGFTDDGREYVIVTDRDTRTPTPWSNVLANPDFGCVVSESGQAYTWSENAHEFRLTPWQNDPVGDAAGEAFYIRDEESRYYWSPTPLPAKGATPYTTRHGFGYSVFEHAEEGVASELQVFVALDAPVKFAVLKLRNESERSRRLSLTGYVEWVLGDLPAKTGMHVITEFDARSGVLFARNPYNSEFPRRTAFFDVDAPTRSVTGDRCEFIGRSAALDHPAAMVAADLSGRTGAALDPCGAIRVACQLGPGEAREFVFRLGAGRDADDAAAIALRHQGRGAASDALEKVRQYWQRTLGAVQVSTPDSGLNFLANGWLVYQVLACRLWGRSGYYQSGGAFGFRDQLQDVMALLHCEPRLAREHLLRCAAHQFIEGDVQHWWHPPLGRGIRSLCSDDFLWLPLAACRYVGVTGDAGILDEPVPFLEGRPLAAGEDSYYDLPARSETAASLYDHCVRALLHGMRYGAHGLPLMGSGDWNDAMNLVGVEGKGESVWLAFFLHTVLEEFAEIARQRNDSALVERCDQEAQGLRSSIAAHGWDGAWYRRAYFDDGTPLGSATDPECRIDSIAQSWAVLAGIDDGGRPRLAMEAVDRRLVARGEGLVRLLEPPFDASSLEPGYIKGYAPGIRENGGQYTHAAIWAAMAFAALGDGTRAEELLSIINPINHAKTAAAVAVFKTEPFVVPADVYACAPHTGRGGWTWYTGSAGWMYRLIVESLIGLTVRADTLSIAPCLPPTWPRVELDYRYKNTLYHIEICRASGMPADLQGHRLRVVLDDMDVSEQHIKLVDDRRSHLVQVTLVSAEDSQWRERDVAARGAAASVEHKTHRETGGEAARG